MVVLIALLAWCGPRAHGQEEIEPLWTRSLGYKSAPAALATDLNLDGRYEIVQPALSSELTVLDPVDGRPLWRRKLGEVTLLTPAVGHFTGNYRINLLVLASSGRLFMMDGPTGEALLETDIGYVPAAAPTVFPWTGEEGTIPYREGVILQDAARTVHGYLIEAEQGLRSVFSHTAPAQLSGAPVVGHTNLPGARPHIAYITREGRIGVFSARNPGRAAWTLVSNISSRRFELGLLMADLDGDERHELVTTDDAGYIYAFDVEEEQLVPMWPGGQRSILKEPAYLTVAIDVTGDGADDLLVPREDGYILLDGRTGKSIWDPQLSVPGEFVHARAIQSPPALVRAANGRAYALFSDATSGNLLNLQTRSIEKRLVLGQPGGTTALITPIPQGALPKAPPAPSEATMRMLAYIHTPTDGAGRQFDMGLEMLPSTPGWYGLRGSPNRTGRPDVAYLTFTAAQRFMLSARIDELLERARLLAEPGEGLPSAIHALDEVLATVPNHSEARELRRRYWIRLHKYTLISAGVGMLLLVSVTFWFTFRAVRGSLMRSGVEKALEQGDQARAAEILGRLVKGYPRRQQYVAELADLQIARQKFDAETAPVYERAHELFPEQDQYVRALATAYSSIPRMDPPAVAVYEQMIQLARHPGPWFFFLGQAFQANERHAEALEAYRSAIVHEFEDERLPALMTELYLSLDIATPDVLPTLDRLFDERGEDADFLRLYCRGSLEARRYDDRAHAAATRLLEVEPDNQPAHTIMATRLLQAGRHKEAMKHAQSLLQRNANDSVGLRLLGACYAAENRLDATAMEIFARALQSNPEAPDILIAVSHGFIQQGREDDEAEQIYRRALVHAPNDETLLARIAHIAAQHQDDETVMRTIETLLHLGRRDRDLILQLANAYCRLGIVSDKAEPVYKEALTYQPDHATIQENLAAIWLRREQTGSEAMRIFQAVHDRTPERFDIGVQLARCYHAADMPEKTLELAQRLLDREPDNSELKKLIAAASAKANQLDSAIAGYEQVLSLDEHDEEAICALSQLYGRKQRHDDDAIRIFNQAVQLQPGVSGHYLSSARAYAHRGAYDHAVHVLRNMLTQIPDQIGAAIHLMEKLADAQPAAMRLRWYLIEVQIFDGRLRDARNHIVDILRMDPSQTERALRYFDQIVEKNPKDAMALLEQGRIYRTQGREREARTTLETAQRAQPENDEIARDLLALYQETLEKRDSAEIRFRLGQVAMQLDKYDLAISCFQQTSRDYRWESESVRNLARCFMAKGMLDLALQELRRVSMEDDVKELLYDLGERYEAVDDVPGAVEVYKAIFASDISFRDVKGKIETLTTRGDASGQAERTAILNSLSQEAQQRYQLIEELGRGAMGIVYKARDNELEEIVAVKILPENLIRNPEAVRRFRQEARNARRLSHPHVVRIHDIGEEMGRKYISMEFVKGTDLKHKFRQCGRKMELEDVLRYMQQTCEAMAYAHSIGIVHRDIKPANMMLTQDDQIKIADFGIAKMVESSSLESTSVGMVIGTPLYMSPEQVKGLQVDGRADIYSMGVVFYELLNGRPPFVEGDLAHQHLFVEPKPLTNVPEAIAAIVMKCLAKNREERWQSAEELLKALRSFSSGQTVIS